LRKVSRAAGVRHRPLSASIGSGARPSRSLHGISGAVWIDPEVSDPEALQELLKPFPAEETSYHEVGRLVNNPRNNRPDLILPLAG
jgi:hypothetical protein